MENLEPFQIIIIKKKKNQCNSLCCTYGCSHSKHANLILFRNLVAMFLIKNTLLFNVQKALLQFRKT